MSTFVNDMPIPSSMNLLNLPRVYIPRVTLSHGQNV